ncbi:hypothetical protein [Photobacterium sp. 1_MG-2023]|uniref:hypothetical protein n=1 Tax=Photobacterium sp. 1_MG-2023 TaxID=3062646 RepID=UPI0026E1CB50|nr:hypothetical protein [Photobacterium sp. 1_MG-2023]MDO6707887.1 hypothetical protein [Photobacterium sp. 1_MG-2023]
MGIAKRHMEHMEDQINVATEIAIEAGVLERCEYCEATVFQGEEDVEEAYKLGSHRFKNGDFGGLFESQLELTDAIKESVESGDHAADMCYHCHEKMYGDD